MLDRATSAVLLVKSIEELDRTGAVLPLADREHASRETLRELDLTGERLRASGSGRELSRALRSRATRLLEPLEVRHPALTEVLDHSRWPPWIDALALGAALLGGLALSAFDGTRRIDILAVPILGVIGWNLLVYFVLAVAWLRRTRTG